MFRESFWLLLMGKYIISLQTVKHKKRKWFTGKGKSVLVSIGWQFWYSWETVKCSKATTVVGNNSIRNQTVMKSIWPVSISMCGHFLLLWNHFCCHPQCHWAIIFNCTILVKELGKEFKDMWSNHSSFISWKPVWNAMSHLTPDDMLLVFLQEVSHL